MYASNFITQATYRTAQSTIITLGKDKLNFWEATLIIIEHSSTVDYINH